MTKRCLILLCLLTFCIAALDAQQLLTLDDCRTLALENNKQLKISDQRIKKAGEEQLVARSQYFPNLSFSGGYVRNQKQLSLFDSNKFLPVGSFAADGSFAPTGEYALVPKSEFEIDIRHIFAGNLSLVQPLYTGGKLTAYNKMAGYAVEAAESLKELSLQEVLIEVEQAYWQVVSLVAKKRLSTQYVNLIQQMNHDVAALLAEGLSTRADQLSVRVRLNEAELSEAKVDNALQLSRMLLCQLCGLPIDTDIVPADEHVGSFATQPEAYAGDMNQVYMNRPEVKALDLATKVSAKKEAVALSEMLPNVALTGNYLLTNPNAYNGVEHKFAGSWNVGIMINMPIFHFGEHTHKRRAARAETHIRQYELAEAKDKISLQVNQSLFRLAEAEKRLESTRKNMESAQENLRYADIGFREGVIPVANAMEAQTAWLKAQSEHLDAQIEVVLCRLYLDKATGSLNIEH